MTEPRIITMKPGDLSGVVQVVGLGIGTVVSMDNSIWVVVAIHDDSSFDIQEAYFKVTS